MGAGQEGEAGVSPEAERTLLQAYGCRLTDRRLITASGATFAVRHVTSTRLAQRVRGTELPVGLGLAAVAGLVMVSGAAGVALCIGSGLLAVLTWALVRHTEYTLFLTTASGEQEAIISRDRSFMVQLRDALNDALTAAE
jgi:hypothetical protein